MPSPDEFYTKTQREFQRLNDSENLANAVAAAIVSEEILPDQADFIASRDYFFLSTVNDLGEPTVSYKGGPVGLVRILSPAKIAFPNFDGNGMFFSMGNVRDTGKIGMLFMDWETPRRVRLQGTATVSTDKALLDEIPGANMVVEVDVDAVFFNCARYIHKHTRVETSKYVPDQNGEQPFPSWKRIDMLQPVLPAKDQGRAEEAGGVITNEEYADRLERGTS